jgi:hypothetical protein
MPDCQRHLRQRIWQCASLYSRAAALVLASLQYSTFEESRDEVLASLVYEAVLVVVSLAGGCPRQVYVRKQVDPCLKLLDGLVGLSVLS